MEKIKLTSIYLKDLHQAEFGQFIDRFFEDFKQSSISLDTDADFKKLYEALKTKVPVYTKALEQIRANEETKKIAELDKIRDADIQALRDSIKPYKNSKTEAKKKAYEALKIVLDQYKNLQDEAYEAETKKVDTLVSVLKSEEYSDDVSVLNIGEFLQELEQSNRAFDELFAHRSVENLKKEYYDIRAIRKEMTSLYRQMSQYILTLAGIKQDEFYKKVLDVLNNSRKYYADVLAIRNAKKSKSKTEQPTETH